ncbi:MAG: phage tail tape measure protein [Xanthomonadales bacterium]|jgi:methyl-accepting chemotaxis protein|nr:phage tail tape measure protein [Xanthomonadales bacterium]
MSDKNDVRIDVVGSVDGFKGATAQAARELDGLKENAIAAGGGLKESSAAAGMMEGATIALTSVVATATAGIAAWAAAQLASAVAIKDTADEIDKLSQRMGESTESVSELRYAFELNDASMEEMATLMKTLANKAQDAARGAGQASAAYKAMGISVTDTNGEMKTSRQLLEEVADKIASYRDGAAKAALVQDALGGQWVRMIPLLNQGAQGLRDASEEAHKLGVVFGEDLTKKADALNDDLTRLKAAAEGVKISLGQDLIPSLADTAAEMVKLKIEGHGVLAVLRGIAGIGKIPFDVILGPSKADLSVDAQLKGMKSELAGLEADLKSPANAGLLGRMVFGKKGDLEQRVTVLRNQIASMEKFRDKLEPAKAADEAKPNAPVPVRDKPAPRARGGGGGSARVSDYERTMETLQERIAVTNLELNATEKLTAAEREHAKWQSDVESGRKKLTAAQYAAAEAEWKEYLALDKKNAAYKEFRSNVERQEQANVKATQAMIERIAKAEEETEVYGLTEAQISAVIQARLTDALAMAREGGATEEMLKPMREELELRGKLTEALSARDAKKYDLEDAKKELSDTGKEMDEFAKSAAKNIQSAMADFLFDPFSEGLDGMLRKFIEVVQRMLAEAVAAQLAKALFRNMGSTGEVGGIIGAGIAALGFHKGGVVGEPGGASFTRTVPALAFASAPRFHQGGFAGDEVPAILQKGERVLTKEQQRESLRPAAPQNIRIINAFDSSVVGDFLGSASGERIIMNAVQRNASAMRQALA